MIRKNLSNEDVVTKLLSDREILKRQEALVSSMNVTNPNYDLTNYLMNKKREVSRFGPKYIFVK